MSTYCPTYKWGQTDTHIIITIDVNEECVEGHNINDDGTVEVKGEVPKKGNFELKLDLNQEINHVQAQVQLLPRSMKIKLPKRQIGNTWKMLQKSHIPKPVQEKKDFDFYIHSDDDESDDSDDEEEEGMEGLDKATRDQIKDVKRSFEQGYKPPPEKKPRERALVFGPFPIPDEFDTMLLLVALVHIYMAPFTKVEESFNMQATYDLMYHRLDISNYDHLEFPGVVPRTFLGAISTAVLASPLTLALDAVHGPRLSALYVVRCALAFLSMLGMSALRVQVGKKFGPRAGVTFIFVCIVQFHLLFYCSRPLPNTFAQIFTNVAFSYILQDEYNSAFMVLTAAGVIFRSELVLLYIPYFAYATWAKKLGKTALSPIRTIATCVGVALASLLLTVCVDSLFWRRLSWPEGEVLYFNTILNKSHEWGTSPFYWYFVSAIPRCMLGTLLFIPSGLYFNIKIREYVLPAFVFVCLYSLLPHKELRFIIYVIPLLNCIAAVEVVRLFENKDKPGWQKYFFRVAITILAFTLFMAFGFLRISGKNYPGGDAMLKLHEAERISVMHGLRPYVHIDVAAAQQGITRYLELPEPWKYSKKEGPHDMKQYSHLINENKTIDGFTPIIDIEAFDPTTMFSPRGRKSSMKTVLRIFKRDDLKKQGIFTKV